jgi:hypothetical protein
MFLSTGAFRRDMILYRHESRRVRMTLIKQELLTHLVFFCAHRASSAAAFGLA